MGLTSEIDAAIIFSDIALDDIPTGIIHALFTVDHSKACAVSHIAIGIDIGDRFLCQVTYEIYIDA